MFKVLIADDEQKVCQLINGLIDWKELGLEVIGLANDGTEALAMIENNNPDIVITDIRMPGYDGIELIKKAKEKNPDINFIIVSGYRHFDYAHNAIKYGVEDYLLKPLKKAELMSTLHKMIEKQRKKSEGIHQAECLKQRIEDDSGKLKLKFITDLLLKSASGNSLLTIEEVNAEYHFNFVNDNFQAVVVKPDIVYEEGNESIYPLLLKKSKEIVCKFLKPYSRDFIIYEANLSVCSILNFSEENGVLLRKQLKQIMDSINELNDVFLNVKTTIGVGEVVHDINKITETILGAKQAVDNRLVSGTGGIIQSKSGCMDAPPVSDYVTGAFRRQFLSFIESLDNRGVAQMINDLNLQLQSTNHITGCLILGICNEIIDIFDFAVKNLSPSDWQNKLVKSRYYERLDMCGTMQGVFTLLTGELTTYLKDLAEEKKQAYTKPIREAKQYMKENYALPLTLEEVSRRVGFNPSYFSTLFKKETKLNFLEYLADIRVENAKQLLCDTTKTVVEIAEQVGYSDLKHFSKLFKRTTGLTPSEYRKLYY